MRLRSSLSRLTGLLTVIVGTGALAACGAATDAGAGSGPTKGDPSTLQVVASFYPIAYAVQQVGGSHVSVTSLTKPGQEPHDLELKPQDVATVSTAGLVVYARGFQAAVDTAVDQEAGDRAFDVAPAANLTLAAPPEGDAVDAGSATAAPGDNGAKDPHFWLDPQRYAAVATAIGQRLATSDPANAAAYAQNTKAFTDQLATLDHDFSAGLASCSIKDLVTSHAAFGYLSQRYGFTQVPIAGLSPDAEPSAAKLAQVADFVREHHITTIYAETLVEPAFAETVSHSTGAALATLDPIEGITDKSAGHDYLEVMRADLAALRTGQGCS